MIDLYCTDTFQCAWFWLDWKSTYSHYVLFSLLMLYFILYIYSLFIVVGLHGQFFLVGLHGRLFSLCVVLSYFIPIHLFSLFFCVWFALHCTDTFQCSWFALTCFLVDCLYGCDELIWRAMKTWVMRRKYSSMRNCLMDYATNEITTEINLPTA